MQQSPNRPRIGAILTVASMAVLLPFLPTSPAQIAVAQSQQAGAMSSDGQTMEEQIADLRATLARLEAQLGNGGKGSGMSGKGGMGSSSSGKAAGGMGGGMGGGKGGGMGSSSAGMGGQSGMGNKGGMGMGGMSGKTGSSPMGAMTGTAAVQASLPGFPGTSHLYHIGASDFFLDHDEHTMLDTEQRAALGRIREQAQLESATFDRQIAELEQELWVLTASDQPDIRKIEEKVRKIEQQQGDQRLAFIRAVGSAAQILTEEQRAVLAGTDPMTASSQPADHAH